MEKNKTVSEIDDILESSSDLERKKILEVIKDDPRKTVQKLIIKYQKRYAKEQAEIERVKNMWRIENYFFSKGYNFIAGIDEAGRGPLAGPVVAAAVILPKNCFIEGLNDSKKINAKKREELYREIQEKAISCSYGVVDNHTVDRINILQATRYAMVLASKSLKVKPEYILIDGEENPYLKIPQTSIVKGDSHSASIAAASIIAKVHRDYLMKIYDSLYPEYAFSKHKGYGTEEHLKALRKYGRTKIHRLSFSPVNKY